MSDYISRQAALALVTTEKPQLLDSDALYMAIDELPPAQLHNAVNLCDTCRHTYPGCPSGDDVIFGDGVGGDNICACAKYETAWAKMRKEK